MDEMLKTIAAFKCEELWLVPRKDSPQASIAIQLTDSRGHTAILIRLVSDPTVSNRALQSVQQINTGAAPLGREVISRLEAQYPNIAIRQAWGMTESCSCLTLTPPSDQTYENAHTVGKAVAGTVLKVVRPGTDEEVGVGASGEVGAPWLIRNGRTKQC
jgi:acyl-CoA synthetase (AMP-forming)/AMP-acid ligase II